MRQLIVEAGPFTFEARFEEETALRTCAAFHAAMPFLGEIVHVRWDSARGKRLGRQPGQRPKSDRLAPKVMAHILDGRSYRWIARDLGISKNTVGEIGKRQRATCCHDADHGRASHVRLRLG